MERIFLSYQYTGENPEYLEEYLLSIKDVLAKKDREVFYSCDKELKKDMSPEDIYCCYLEQQRGSDIFMAIINEEQPSRNIALELEEATTLNQSRILFIKKGVEASDLRHKSTLIHEFEDLPKLYELIDRLIW